MKSLSSTQTNNFKSIIALWQEQEVAVTATHDLVNQCYKNIKKIRTIEPYLVESIPDEEFEKHVINIGENG